MTEALSTIKDLQKGLVRMPALRKRIKAPLVMMPCRIPCNINEHGMVQIKSTALLVRWVV